MKKIRLELSDIMYEVLTSPVMKELYGSEDPSIIILKILEENMVQRIKRGDFENFPFKEDIYRAFNARPEKKEKKS